MNRVRDSLLNQEYHTRHEPEDLDPEAYSSTFQSMDYVLMTKGQTVD
jgi:hypothetical protein